MEPRIILIGDTHINRSIRLLKESDLEVLTIAGESPEARIEMKITSEMVDAIKGDGYHDPYIEPREKFKNRWKGGTGPGSTAPMKRGRR